MANRFALSRQYDMLYFNDNAVNSYRLEKILVTEKQKKTVYFTYLGQYKKIGFNKYLLKDTEGKEAILYAGWFTMRIDDKKGYVASSTFRRELNFLKVRRILKLAKDKKNNELMSQ